MMAVGIIPVMYNHLCWVGIIPVMYKPFYHLYCTSYMSNCHNWHHYIYNRNHLNKCGTNQQLMSSKDRINHVSRSLSKTCLEDRFFCVNFQIDVLIMILLCKIYVFSVIKCM